jgi:hypothetical protein
VTHQKKENHVRRLIVRLAGLRNDDGMNTAEYAVGTLAAVAFAGVLLKVLTSPATQASLAKVISEALK